MGSRSRQAPALQTVGFVDKVSGGDELGLGQRLRVQRPLSFEEVGFDNLHARIVPVFSHKLLIFLRAQVGVGVLCLQVERLRLAASGCAVRRNWSRSLAP